MKITVVVQFSEFSHSVHSFRPFIQHTDTSDQGWVFAMAKSIFARTVEKTGKNRQKLEHTKLYRNTPIWVINEIF